VSVRGVEQHLRCDVIWGAANSLLPLQGSRSVLRGQSRQLDVHVPVEEQIPELEVAVDDLVGVHVVAGTDELDHEEPGLWFGEAATAAEHVHEGARGA
jgi:hypothetical protein